ncbi:MAG TPA: class I SAM-dependent methyltransferase [Thermoanaerobaculia bacterium]|nr:class I SAM-dependent methyltransferase [Thermoanaerobaculia bacterium]
MDKPDYGIDAPGVVRNLLLIGAAVIAISLSPRFAGTPRELSRFFWMGAVFVVEGLLLILYAKVGKFRHRDRMLRKVEWRGDEHFLDVGTGRGLLLIGAARQATKGRGIGIDIFSKKDLSSNSLANTLRNVELEGVKDLVEIHEVDARYMDFLDSSFDVVLSNLCIHNIPKAADRDKACREIVRVTKRGGSAVISDFRNTGAYARVFRDGGMNVTRSGPYLFDTFPPLRIITARKPA